MSVCHQIPLDIQVAKKIAIKFSIRLVKDIETGQLIPHFFSVNRFVEDKLCDAIRGFIKQELIDVFTFSLDSGSFSDKPERCNELREYCISESDLKKYQKNTGFLNSLTKNILRNIRDFQDIVIEESELDSEPTLINCQNGILDLVTGQMLEHTPDKLIRNIVNAKFIFTEADKEPTEIDTESIENHLLFYKVVSDALWDKNKDDTENKEVVKSFMETNASCLIGNNEHKLVYIIIGEPNAGKSTLLEVLLNIFGTYGTTFNNSALLVSSRTSNDIRPDIIALRGRRILAGSEANKSEKFDNALLKQISGNDKISVRKPHKGDMVNFIISGKLLLVTNYCPKFTDLDDQAFLNRIVLIDFNNVPTELDTNLKEKLLAPDCRNQIFSYLASIAMKIIRKKEIFIHERFKSNKQRILINQNSSVSFFWKEHIHPYEEYNIFAKLMPHHPVNLLYSVMYINFCQKLSLKPLSLEAFGKEFRLISDQFPMVTWKRGESNNFYIGFDVVGGDVNRYNSMVNNAFADKFCTGSEAVFE
jgi:P4 family phage/plasmid primase-like protien